RNRSLAAAISSGNRFHTSVESVRRRGRCPTPVVNPSFHCRRPSSIDISSRPLTVPVHSSCWVVTVMTRLLSGFGHPQKKPNSRDPLPRGRNLGGPAYHLTTIAAESTADSVLWPRLPVTSIHIWYRI